LSKRDELAVARALLAKAAGDDGVERLRGDQCLDYEAGVERDRIGEEKLWFLDREDSPRGGPATACRGHDPTGDRTCRA
jgi:hypothetical protein